MSRASVAPRRAGLVRVLGSLAAILITAAPAGAERLPVRHYTLADGLPHNSITALYQDRRGSLWIGTAEGLARFDGQRFVTYGVDRGLGHPYVTAITEDAAGRLWVGTQAGVSRLNDDWGRAPEQTFVSYEVGGRARSVNGLHVGDDNVLWCATYSGLFRAPLDAEDTPAFQGVPRYDDAKVLDVVTDRRGRVWIWILDAGLHLVGTGEHRRPEAAESHGASRGWFLRGHDQRVWLASRAGVFELDAASDTGASPWRPLPLASPDAIAVAAGRRGSFWAVTSRGLLRSRDGRQSWYSTSHGLGASLNRILLVDREGHVWAGSSTDGLFQVIDGPIVSFTIGEGMPGQAVDSVFEGIDGRIYAFVRNAGVAEIEGDVVRPVAGSARLRDERWPRHALLSSRGDWWVLRPPALCRIDGPVPRFDRPPACFPIIPADQEPFVAPDSMDIPDLYEHEDGRLWFTSRGALHRFDPATATFSSEAVRSSRPTLGVVPTIADRSAAIWFVSNEEIGRWIDGRLTLLEPTDGLREIRPRSLLLDRAGRLWIGMRDGGVSMAAQPSAPAPAFVSYTMRDGLSSNSVWSIAEDDAGRIYLGTGRGLDRLDPATGRIRRFTTADGLAADLVNRCIRDARGFIWIATPGGLSRLDPRADAGPLPPPPTWLTRVEVSGETIGLPDRGVADASGLALPPGGNRLVVEFGAVSFGGPRSLQYQYRLENLDADWGAPTDQRSVTYARLAPGRYTFAVRAINGGDAGAPARLTFRVLRPAWQQPWFVALVVAVLGAGVLGVHRLRVRRLLAIDRIRREIARDLHDDIGAGLVQVAILSEVAKRDAPPVQASSLDEIATLARSMREAMSDIVWSIDPRASGFADLVRRMQDAARHVLAGDIRVEFHVPPPAVIDRIRLRSDRSRHVLLVLKEAVANVARHARATRVDIDLLIAERELLLRIKDDGCGFEPGGAHDGRGLPNLARRAAALGGRFTVESAPGRGTTIELRAPL